MNTTNIKTILHVKLVITKVVTKRTFFFLFLPLERFRVFSFGPLPNNQGSVQNFASCLHRLT
jgi:hypothetical protein